ncbi:MAG: hypothetical protein R6X02_36185 [Enhygromyxa sp.]
MTTDSPDHLRMVGRQVLAARKRSAMSRAAFAQAVGVSERTLARLEGGEEVRASTYLAVTRYLVSRHSSLVDLTDRIALLSALGQARVIELVERFEKMEHE